MMLKKLVLLSVFLASAGFSLGPVVDCRFGALTDDGLPAIDQVITYPLIPGTFVHGKFDPYNFDLTVLGNALNIGIFLDREPISVLQIPILNIVTLPLGATVFGLNSVFHEPVGDLVSVHYECIRSL